LFSQISVDQFIVSNSTKAQSLTSSVEDHC